MQLGPLNVLVGPNMGGKSNIVDVCRFLYDFFFPQPGVDGLFYALAQRAGIDEIRWKGDQDKLVSFFFEFQDEDEANTRYSYALEIVGGTGGYSSIQKESLTMHRGGQDFGLIVQESGARWLANRDGKSFVSVIPQKSAIENAPPNWDGYSIRSSVASWRFYRLVPAIMNRANPIGAAERLDPHGENLSAWLMVLQTRFPETFNKINEVARDVFPGIQRLLTWPSQVTVHLAAEELGLNRPINVWQMSDGELAFIALLSLVYSPPLFGGGLFCIEEPESHLHPKLLSVLVELLRQVRQEIKDSAGALAQLIITTQSPYLLDQMSIDEVIWVEKRDGVTRTVRPADEAHLRKLVEDRDLGLGDLMYSGTLGGDR
jgi:predicted ATPase